MELIIDPVCSLAFENEPDDARIMLRPPRAVSSALLPASQFVWSIAQGVAVLIATAALFAASLRFGLPPDQARALVFGALIASIVALVLVNRSFEPSLVVAIRRPNPTLWIVIAAAIAIFGVTLSWRPARNMFHFGDFHDHDLLIATTTGGLLLLFLEFAKFIMLKHSGPSQISPA